MTEQVLDERIRLRRGTDGRLWVRKGEEERAVAVRRCFPWSEPGGHVSLRDEDGAELALISHPDDLDQESREALEEALVQEGFVLRVTRIRDVEDEIEIRRWEVDTEQGGRTFQTPLDDWPREVPGGGFVVRDVSGDLYHVAEPGALDRRSRQLLWAYAE